MLTTQFFILLFGLILGSSDHFKSSETNINPQITSAKQIDQTILDLYTSIELSEEHSPDWNLFRSLFMDGAHLIHITESNVYKMSPEDFINNYKEQIDKGTLTSFKESEIYGVEESFGNISHVFSTYEATFTTPEGNSKKKGINSIQLMKTADQWKIVSIIWFDENANNSIPPEYLPKQGDQ